MNHPLRILYLEDEAKDAELVQVMLVTQGFSCHVTRVETEVDFCASLERDAFNLILADYNLPQWRGTEALEILCRENQDVPLIVVTGYLGEEKAVDYIKQGATDCVLKDRLVRLPVSVRRAL